MTKRLLETNRHIYPEEMNDITRLIQRRKLLPAGGVVTEMGCECYNTNECSPDRSRILAAFQSVFNKTHLMGACSCHPPTRELSALIIKAN
jgi:hypothetical protein